MAKVMAEGTESKHLTGLESAAFQVEKIYYHVIGQVKSVCCIKVLHESLGLRFLLHYQVLPNILAE